MSALLVGRAPQVVRPPTHALSCPLPPLLRSALTSTFRLPQGVMMSEACIHSCGHSTQPAPDVEADVMVLVKWAETIAAGTAAVDSSVRCPLDVAAFAAVCCLDQWDRPIGGVIWLCPRLLGLMATKVDGQSEDDLFRFTSHVLAHEFAHILGFDEQLFDLFRWADGTPRVSRNALGVPTGSLVSVC